MRAGAPRELPAFPDIEAEIGYNPARFLHTPANDHDSIGDTSELVLAQATIRGIDNIETIRAWIEVEVALGRDDGSPRQQVIAWLNQRQATLRNTGSQEREQQVSLADETTPDDDNATVDAEITSDDAAAEPATQSPSTAATTSNATAVATDGGEAVSDPTCSECEDELDREEIAGRIGHWCHTCRDFREPATTDSAGAPPSTPRCPDCRAELTPEDVGDETAFWCSYCGGFREPLDEADPVEAVA